LASFFKVATFDHMLFHAQVIVYEHFKVVTKEFERIVMEIVIYFVLQSEF